MKIAKTLNLGHRGMILIAFPLLCHLIFVIILGFRLNEIHGYMVAETKSQNIIRQGHLVDSAMLNQSLDDYFSMNKGSLSHEEQEEQFRSMTHRVNEFVKLIYNDPKHKEGLRRYQNAIKNIHCQSGNVWADCSEAPTGDIQILNCNQRSFSKLRKCTALYPRFWQSSGRSLPQMQPRLIVLYHRC